MNFDFDFDFDFSNFLDPLPPTFVIPRSATGQDVGVTAIIAS